MSPIWHDGPLPATGGFNGSPIAWRVDDPGPADRHRLASALVAHAAGIDVEGVRLARSPAGAPLVAAPAGWHVSLSHRAGLCLVGVAKRPIGVDLEYLDGSPPLWDMLTINEAHTLRMADPASWPGDWLRRWTMKEAHAKRIGEPRRIAPESIETILIDRHRGIADFAGSSRCWTRDNATFIETIAVGPDPA